MYGTDHCWALAHSQALKLKSIYIRWLLNALAGIAFGSVTPGADASRSPASSVRDSPTPAHQMAVLCIPILLQTSATCLSVWTLFSRRVDQVDKATAGSSNSPAISVGVCNTAWMYARQAMALQYKLALASSELGLSFTSTGPPY